MKLIIDASAHDQRADRFLRKRFPNIARNEIYRLMRTHPVRRAGKRLKPGDRIYAGDVLEFRWPGALDTAPAEQAKLQGELLLIEQATDYLVVFKPVGLKTIPDQAGERSLALLVQSAFPEEQTATFRSSPVSRLDRNTSGLVLFGRNYAGLKHYNELMCKRQIRKYYLAIIFGTMEAAGEYSVPMQKDRRSNQVIVGQGKMTHTRVRPLATNGEKSLVEIELITGHAHQIRALLAHLNYPIEGDPKYGRGSGHQWLTAHRLAFDGREIYYLAPEFRTKLKEEFNYVAGPNDPDTSQQLSI